MNVDEMIAEANEQLAYLDGLLQPKGEAIVASMDRARELGAREAWERAADRFEMWRRNRELARKPLVDLLVQLHNLKPQTFVISADSLASVERSTIISSNGASGEGLDRPKTAV